MRPTKTEGPGELPYLDTFSVAAELCNFTAAARALDLTQAAVSQRIHALERALDQALFRREKGRVVLTDAGRTLYDYAQRILALHREIRASLTGREAPVAGELVIAASSIPGDHLLPVLLPGFARKHPQIHVRASVTDSQEVMSQLERGDASLGLVGRKTDDPHFEFRPLARDHLVLVLPPRHPLTRKRKISLADLTPYPVVLREAGSGSRHCFENGLERTGRSLADFQVALELGSNEAIKRAVARGVGVAVLSIFAVQKELSTKNLLIKEITDCRCDRDMFVALDRRRVLPLPARLFLHFLESQPAPSFAP
jgi:DNA-binding transcriptional LysR family regulator